MKKLVEKAISTIKREPYKLDEAMTSGDLFIILRDKFAQVVRGMWKSLFFGKHSGIVFAGKGVKIRHASHISSKGGLTLGDGVCINALSKGAWISVTTSRLVPERLLNAQALFESSASI